MLKEIRRNLLFYQRFQDEMLWAIWLLVRTFIFWPIGLIGVVVVLTALLHARGDPPDFNLFRAGARGIVDFSNALVRDAPPGQVRETLAYRSPATGCGQRFVLGFSCFSKFWCATTNFTMA